MKKLIAVFLALSLLFCLCACKAAGDQNQSNKESKSDRNKNKKETTAIDATDFTAPPQIFDAEQYMIYQNLFFNGQKASFIGQEMTVTGVFTSIRDSYNNVTRYYCWGYYDQTKCCDWQWELQLDDTQNLPANGSKVTVTGTFAEDENALDKVWLTGVAMTTDEAYTGETYECDLCLMNATLERVQLINMQQFPEEYEGKTIRLYGRVVDPATIQHPYYDNAWMQTFTTDGEVPAVGLEAIVSGVYSSGNIDSATVAVTTDY